MLEVLNFRSIGESIIDHMMFAICVAFASWIFTYLLIPAVHAPWYAHRVGSFVVASIYAVFATLVLAIVTLIDGKSLATRFPTTSRRCDAILYCSLGSLGWLAVLYFVGRSGLL